MNEHSRQALETYYKEAASWNQDRVRALSSSRRVAWYVAGAAATIAVLEAFALATLTPLKTVVPYTLMVDRTTGYVQALQPGETPKISPDGALTQSFLAQYVTGREGFDASSVNTSYRKVALWSAGNARNSYISQMQANNPASPLVAYPRGTFVEARVKSVSPVGADQAFVRFDTIRTDPNGTSQLAGSWVSIIKFRYSGEPMKLEDRFVNPLGFQVVSYRRDAEALPPPAPAALQNTAVRPAATTPLSMAPQGLPSTPSQAREYYGKPTGR
jgi:type IV secretion system protein VirB8